ncbi:MAG: TROVE domain-containing protein [Mycobacteriales bacterium]
MGYTALLGNLRNRHETGVDDAVAAQVAARLADPGEVARSRQLPLRFLSAYRAVPSLRWAPTLESALQASLRNVPALPGRTLVLVDRSASMFGPLSARSAATRADAAALFGAALAMRAEHGDLVQFGTDSRAVRPRQGESLLRVLERFGSLGGTNTAAAVRAHYRRHDRVLIVTDEQAWGRLARRGPDRSGPGAGARRPLALRLRRCCHTATTVPAAAAIRETSVSPVSPTACDRLWQHAIGRLVHRLNPARRLRAAPSAGRGARWCRFGSATTGRRRPLVLISPGGEARPGLKVRAASKIFGEFTGCPPCELPEDLARPDFRSSWAHEPLIHRVCAGQQLRALRARRGSRRFAALRERIATVGESSRQHLRALRARRGSRRCQSSRQGGSRPWQAPIPVGTRPCVSRSTPQPADVCNGLSACQCPRHPARSGACL